MKGWSAKFEKSKPPSFLAIQVLVGMEHCWDIHVWKACLANPEINYTYKTEKCWLIPTGSMAWLRAHLCIPSLMHTETKRSFCHYATDGSGNRYIARMADARLSSWLLESKLRSGLMSKEATSKLYYSRKILVHYAANCTKLACNNDGYAC